MRGLAVSVQCLQLAKAINSAHSNVHAADRSPLGPLLPSQRLARRHRGLRGKQAKTGQRPVLEALWLPPTSLHAETPLVPPDPAHCQRSSSGSRLLMASRQTGRTRRSCGDATCPAPGGRRGGAGSLVPTEKTRPGTAHVGRGEPGSRACGAARVAPRPPPRCASLPGAGGRGRAAGRRGDGTLGRLPGGSGFGAAPRPGLLSAAGRRPPPAPRVFAYGAGLWPPASPGCARGGVGRWVPAGF